MLDYFIRRVFVTHFVSLLLLSMALAISGCGRESAPGEDVASSVENTLPTTAAESTTAPEQSAESLDTEMPVITLEATEALPVMGTPMPDAAGTLGNGAQSELTPLEVAEAVDCPVESDLDLAGYPAVEKDMGCALEKALFEPIGFNEFGEGPDYDRFMLWFSMENMIYVLLPDGRWETFPDTWTEQEPEFTCNPYDGEPQSPPLPRRGFGKLWCQQPNLQTTMGPVPREERLCQHAVLQTFERGRVLACFEDATVRYFQLRNDGSWAQDIQ
jgi:hypothetical protein